MTTSSLTVFGIRHHGPGCARSLRAALETLEPDIVLVEGPPDAQGVVALLTHADLRPPVALLIYAPEAPRTAAYYPFTTFSPEWQALRYALERGIPARFMDLAQAVTLAQETTDDEPDEQDEAAPPAAPEAGRAAEAPAEGGGEDVPEESARSLRADPIGMLAQAAGYIDHEMWWEHQIEQRQDATDLFAGIMEAMTALREQAAPPTGREAQREAAMRAAIRAAKKEGFQRIAVVCGAWHAPVLSAGSARDDGALLAGLPRLKVQATWIPWTNSRLSSRTGYGAGVRSPGWYEHLWTAPDRVAIRWVSHAARLLREQDLDASSSNVIEAVRLGEALAALRGLPMPGLAELHEAILTVLCGGDPAPMRLIRARLEIGERLGEVPAETPAVPLQIDLAARQRRARLKPSVESKLLDLDLRDETDRARSRLLHQTRLLGIAWGARQRTGRKSGTFHEVWQVQWQVEFALQLIEVSLWGNTVESAATGYLRHLSETAELPRLTELLDGALLADLPDAVDTLLARVGERAVSSDVRRLMEALPPLARVARYGDVRGTRAEGVAAMLDGLFERVVVGLPGACASLDDDAARAMVTAIGATAESVDLLDRPEQRAAWQGVMRELLGRDSVHGLVRGWCCRLLLEGRALQDAELERLASLALSPATPAPQAAAWLEGLLRGSGLLLLQQDALWTVLNAWLRELAPDTFVEMLPLLRRAFAGFGPPERRAMGERVTRLGQASSPARPSSYSAIQLNQARADLILPILSAILGRQGSTQHTAHSTEGLERMTHVQ